MSIMKTSILKPVLFEYRTIILCPNLSEVVPSEKRRLWKAHRVMLINDPESQNAIITHERLL